jgi:ubiquinone/menaquinone biosynthesis C-methylase UbiE
MTTARDEYVSDVPYPRKFVAQIAPPTLRLVLGMNGLPAPSEDDFDYCELGSANGDSLALFAAANPSARFVGVDFNADHTACAKDLAARGEVHNALFLERDFDGLEEEDLPDFDFVTAHGIMSWVSPHKREAALRFAAAKLKPGAALYVSYNALPGWAVIEPLRRLMLDHASRIRGSSLDKAEAAIAYARRLADSGVGFFAQHPTAKSMLALAETAGLAYVVHEYFHSYFEPLYFADVERTLASHGFGFVGQIPLHLNVRELATPPQVTKLARETGSRTEFETLKDFANNEFFRSDVYVKGSVNRSESEMRFFFESTPFGTMASVSQIKRELKLPHYTVDYKGPVYDTILAELFRRPATAMELSQRKELIHLGQSRIGDCLKNLSLGGQVVPMRRSDAETAQLPADSRYALALPFNAVALEGALSGETPLVLASPATGNGVHLSLLELVALRLLTGVPLEEHAAWLEGFAARRGMPLTVGERKIKDTGELGRILPKEIERVRAMAPKLFELGILAKTS